MKPPAFQFYGDDFVAGTSDMTQSEVGAYILLLCRQWATGEIPADYDRLKLIAKGEVSDHVLAKFPDGKNARMEKVRTQRDEWIKKSKLAGERSAAVRLIQPNGNQTSTKWQPNPNQTPNQMATKGQPKAQPFANTPTPTPTLNTVLHNTNGLRPVAFNGKLTPEQTEVANRLQLMLGEQWNDANGRKWLKRCKDERHKAERVVAEVEQASRETRINTTPAQYAEQVWKEFA
jgi:uncharacterized protein YdaU (DUF1376 family)